MKKNVKQRGYGMTDGVIVDSGTEGEPDVLATGTGTGRIRTIQTAYEQELERAIKEAQSQQMGAIADAAHLQSIWDSLALSPAQDSVLSQGSFHNVDKDVAKKLVDWDFYLEGPQANAFTQLVHGTPARHLITLYNGLADGFKEKGTRGPIESISDLDKRIRDRRGDLYKDLYDLGKNQQYGGFNKKDLTAILNDRDKALNKYLDDLNNKYGKLESLYGGDKLKDTISGIMGDMLDGKLNKNDFEKSMKGIEEKIGATVYDGEKLSKYILDVVADTYQIKDDVKNDKESRRDSYPTGEKYNYGSGMKDGVDLVKNILGVSKEWVAGQEISQANLLEQIKHYLYAVTSNPK